MCEYPAFSVIWDGAKEGHFSLIISSILNFELLKSLREQQITLSEDITEKQIVLTVLRTPSRGKRGV